VFGEVVQKLTKDKNSENTNIEKIENNTEEKSSQTVMENQECTMLVPLNTGLTIIKPKFIKKFRDFQKIRKLVVIYSISFIIVAFSFAQISRIQGQKSKTLELSNQVKSYITENTSSDNLIGSNQENKKYTVDFNSLKAINSDTKAWIKVNGIGIDFPVVQAKDNKYYLKHSFDKSYNVCGWAFADYRNSIDGTDKNIIIFGHNRRDGTMFSQMINIIEPEWYNNEENKYITFITENEEVTYEVFSVYQIEVEDYYLQTDFQEGEFTKYIDTVKSRSAYNFNVEVDENDNILTLSTCANDSKYRVILHAKKE
jgi:sortase B